MWPPACPDLLQDVQAPESPSIPVYLSFFEEECRAIVALLRGEAAEPAPGPRELRGLQPQPAGPATSTPLPSPCHRSVPGSSAGDREAAAGPGPAPVEPGCRPQPAAGGGPGARPAPSSSLSRRARRGSRQPSGGGSGTPARCSGRGRLALPRAQASQQLPAAGTGRGARETCLPRPPGIRLKLISPARSGLQRASRASQQTQPSRLPKLAPRDREMKSNSAPASCVMRSREAAAAKVGHRKQPSSKISAGIPAAASCSSLQPPSKRSRLSKGLTSGSATQELACNRTQELKENGINDQTWVTMESSSSSELTSGLTFVCEDAVPAQQSAGDQLSQELEHVKKELKRVKSELEQAKAELADKTAQCEAYQQTNSSLQAQLRAAGMCLKAAAVFDSGDLGRD